MIKKLAENLFVRKAILSFKKRGLKVITRHFTPKKGIFVNSEATILINKGYKATITVDYADVHIIAELMRTLKAYNGQLKHSLLSI